MYCIILYCFEGDVITIFSGLRANPDGWHSPDEETHERLFHEQSLGVSNDDRR